MSTKSFFDFNDLVCRLIVVHDGMQYDLIQGQGQGHELLKVGNSAIFKVYLLPYL